MTTRPCFGKRKAAWAASVSAPNTIPVVSSPTVRHNNADQATFFAEVGEWADQSARVPNSLRAAVLAGLVVGCGLTALDVMGVSQTFRPLTELLAIDPRAGNVLPFMIILGLIGGGRAAATSLLVAHAILRRIGQTSFIAYALGGAAGASAFAVLCFVLMREQPTHGWLIDCVAGGAGGFLYRVFAGVERD